MEHKIFNLNQAYPQVILLGNGVVRSTGIDWGKLIEQCKRADIDLERYREQNKFMIPNNILSFVAFDIDDQERHKRYTEQLNGSVNYQVNEHLDRLVTLSVDAILTTNYTYELEYALNPKYPSLNDNAKRKYMRVAASKPVKEKYLIRTYNQISEDCPEIWHIHGELRRKNSLVFSHEEYARVVNKMLEYTRLRKDDYRKFREELKIKSWIDYFILSDLYIIGFGFDFSEFDLWWLLNRRMREKTSTGKIYFYEPVEANNTYKLKVLTDLGVQVETFGMDMSKPNTTQSYKDFYTKAIEDISIKVGGNK